MKEIYIIRHGESLSNAGEKGHNHDTVSLSEKGKEQALQLAESLDVIPELIVVSSFNRTQETASPYISKHSNTPVETWDVQEFSYMPPQIYKDTDFRDRLKYATSYWESASIYDKEKDTESFHDLIKRMSNLLKTVGSRAENKIVIFSHGRFIHILKLYIDKIKEIGSDNLSEKDIEELKNTHAENFIQTLNENGKFPIDNASVHKLEI